MIIKPMETADEIRGKARVHYASWQEAYAGLVDADYLARMSYEKCEDIAFRFPENILVAKEGEEVIGFAAYGPYRDDTLLHTGEVYALYVRQPYYGTGVGRRLMQAALDRLDYPRIALWVLRDNARAIRFYEKSGFIFDGAQETLTLGAPIQECRMLLNKGESL